MKDQDDDTPFDGAEAVRETWNSWHEFDSAEDEPNDTPLVLPETDGCPDTADLQPYHEDRDIRDLFDQPDLWSHSLPQNVGQRSGARLDADGGYAAGLAARDAREAGSGLKEVARENPDRVSQQFARFHRKRN